MTLLKHSPLSSFPLRTFLGMCHGWSWFTSQKYTLTNLHLLENYHKVTRDFLHGDFNFHYVFEIKDFKGMKLKLWNLHFRNPGTHTVLQPSLTQHQNDFASLHLVARFTRTFKSSQITHHFRCYTFCENTPLIVFNRTTPWQNYLFSIVFCIFSVPSDKFIFGTLKFLSEFFPALLGYTWKSICIYLACKM